MSNCYSLANSQHRPIKFSRATPIKQASPFFKPSKPIEASVPVPKDKLSGFIFQCAGTQKKDVL